MPDPDRVAIVCEQSECTLTLEFDRLMMKCGKGQRQWYTGPRVRKDD
jgi:hypothetical protein